MFSQSSFPEMRRNRRDSIVIASDMLSYAVEGVGKTQLMYKAGLSSAQLNKYMPALVRSELIETQHNHRRRLVYKTTLKGKNFLETFSALAKLIGQSGVLENGQWPRKTGIGFEVFPAECKDFRKRLTSAPKELESMISI